VGDGGGEVHQGDRLAGALVEHSGRVLLDEGPPSRTGGGVGDLDVRRCRVVGGREGSLRRIDGLIPPLLVAEHARESEQECRLGWVLGECVSDHLVGTVEAAQLAHRRGTVDNPRHVGRGHSSPRARR
jgi:hypothetical protein